MLTPKVVFGNTDNLALGIARRNITVWNQWIKGFALFQNTYLRNSGGENTPCG